MVRQRGIIIALIISITFGCLIGSAVTVGFLQYKLKRDAGKIIAQVMVQEKETIMRELGKGLEEEINGIIEKKKVELTRELQKNMEIAIDQYIKMKLKNIFAQ